MRFSILSIFLVHITPAAVAPCYDSSPVYPLPNLSHDIPELQDVFDSIGASLKQIVSDKAFDTSSFSVEVTSSQETLWSSHHTASERDNSRVGAETIDGRSVYRIASITKVFTVLGVLQQHAAGNLSLDDAITNYIEDLIALAQSDLINGLPNPTIVGLPPLPKKGLIHCYEYSGYHKPCTEKDMLDFIKGELPLFAPNQQSTYSNVAFNLLGLVLENVTGISYTDYVTSAIFKPTSMNSTTLEKPNDKFAVLPKGKNYWDVEEGVQRPTGGIYASSSDMSRFLRYVLTQYNGITSALNWINPLSFAAGGNSFYGMPWEIFRSSRILDRPTTFITKGGGVPGYFSYIILIPEYGLGVTILVGGELKLLKQIREAVTVPLLRAVDYVTMSQLAERYSGVYVSGNGSLNSSLTLAVDPDSRHGLVVREFISNGTDVLSSLLLRLALGDDADKSWRVQLIPTLLYRDELAQKGELWRMLVVLDRTGSEHGIWDDFCNTDVDQPRYAGKPLNEIVFWGNKEGHAVEAELSAFRVKLQRKPTVQQAGLKAQKTLENTNHQI
ncbi:hypothetical protein LTR66_013185 [Elasticomyces elasticus]|nr:hypothetical protein LTR66_013185 [Elasticomyces elasticus]